MHSKLAQASATLFVGGAFAGILGYVFQVVMGRLLKTEEYGVFNATMSAFVIFSAPLGTLMLVISRKVSEYRARAESGSIYHLYYSTNKLVLLIGVIALFIFFGFSEQAQKILKSTNMSTVYLFGLMILFNFPVAINNAFLQGMQRFGWFSANTNLNIGFKLIISSLLVWLGYGVAGAIGGVVISFIALWLVSYLVIRNFLLSGRNQQFQSTHFSWRLITPVLMANIAFAVMTQIDMIFVNYYFSPKEAGLYASASILGKAVMYLAGGIPIALFPMVVENHTLNKKSAPLFLQAIALTVILCTGGAIFYFLFGPKIILFLYGETYQAAGELLKYYGFAMIPMALILVAEHFLIAKGRVLFVYLFLLLAPVQLLGIYFFHYSLLQVVLVLGICGLVQAILGYGILLKAFQK